MKICFLRKFLTINDNEVILLPLSIDGLIQTDNIIIVLVGSDDEKEMESLEGRNVFAYDLFSKRLWQISIALETDGSIIPYSDIILNEENKLIAGTTRGTEYLVNIEDGSVTPYNLNQRPW